MDAAQTPLISIIIPARDEEKYLPKCLAALQESAKLIPNPIEVIVVLNRCTDRTEEIAAAAGCRIVSDDTKNLAHIRNSGVRAAKGGIIVTVDADSRVSKNMLSEIVRALGSEKVVGGGVLIIPERWSLGIIVSGLLLLPLVIWYRISGGLFFFRPADFEAISGFDESLSSVEDIDFAKRLKRHARSQGRRFVTLYRTSLVTSCRKFDRFGDWYFVLRPWLLISLLKGRNQAAADKVWYDFEH